MSLAEYKRKRHFQQTAEPRGVVRKHNKSLIFVVQKHQASHLHYDFRLELDGVLKSWAIPKGPSLNPQDKRLAMMVEDHPYGYRDFEGSIPKGNYGAGDVIVWDTGTYAPLIDGPAPEDILRTALKKGHMSIVMNGKKLRGEFSLVRSPHMGENAWLLIKKHDVYASTVDVTKRSESVLSHRGLATVPSQALNVETALASPFKHVKPMLATLTDAPFDDQDWLYEIKWDGYRAIGTWDGKQAELYSRNGLDFSKRYVPIFEALRDVPAPAVLDGEIVMVDALGKSRFELLQNYQRGAEGNLYYYVFDMLWHDGHDMRNVPLIERKQILQRLVADNDRIRFSDHIEAAGRRFFEAAEVQRLEGIMAKHKGSVYKEGYRSKQWLKIKTHKRQEVVIGGFTEPNGSRRYIGALIIGVYDDVGLTYVGHCGSGIPPAQLKPLRARLERLERQLSPFAGHVKPNAPVHWVEPRLVCEVTFREWTKDGRMRQPIFIGLRTDKDPRQVGKELPIATPAVRKPSEGHRASRVSYTNRTKLFWPELGITKGDLLDYYALVSDVMLPYLQDRPCNLLRQPDGYAGTAFFQKEIGDTLPDGVRTVQVYSESNRKNIDYLVCDGPGALQYMVQLGCIEINPWSSRVSSLDRPDWAVIDLDPEGIGFAEVVQVAQVVHKVCDELAIPAYPKTSGKTGIHIFIPLHAVYSYEQSRQLCELLARLVHERTEERTSLERDPKRRPHKIYLDYLQNRESQTLAAPYSVRPTPAASVSTPLHWDEVTHTLDPSRFTVMNMPERIKAVGDLWHPLIGKGISLDNVVEAIELYTAPKRSGQRAGHKEV